MSLVRGTTKLSSGKRYPFWQLKEAIWDKQFKGTLHRYVAYVGKDPVLTESKAKIICKKKGLTMEQLYNVNKLTIIPDPVPNGEQSKRA